MSIPNSNQNKHFWWQAILVLLMIATLSYLGCWQLRRADEKRALLAKYADTSQFTPLATVAMQPHAHHYEQIKINATMQTQRQFLLDNQFYDHQLGYHVLTPVKILGQSKWLLVDRGFIAKTDSDKIAKAPVMQEITGRIYAPTKQTLLLGSVENNPNQWPRIIERVDFKHIEKSLNHPLFPFVIWLDAHAENGFVRDFTPVIMPPERHQAYALQWFGLAFALLCVSVAYFRQQRKSA